MKRIYPPYDTDFCSILCVFLILFGVSTSLWAFDTEPLWRRALGGEITTYPAQGPQGSIYVVADDRALHSLDPLTGETEWIYRPGGRLRDGVVASPDGTIYIHSERQELFAVNPGGVGRWVIKMNAELALGPVTSPDGRLFLLLQDGRLLCVSRHGKILWKRNDVVDVSTDPVVDASGHIWIPFSDGQILGITPWGDELTALRGPQRISVMSLDASGYLWAGGELGDVFLFNLFLLAEDKKAQEELEPVWKKKFVSSPVLAILSSSQESMEVFHADGTALKVGGDAREISRRHLLFSGKSPSLSADGSVFFLSSDGSLQVLDHQGNRTELRGRESLSDPLLSDEGILISGGTDWILYAWNAETAMSGWSQYRGDSRRTGALNTRPASLSREEARKDTGFLFRERKAVSPEISDRLALVNELESFKSESEMYHKLPWADLLLEDLAFIGTLRQLDAGQSASFSHSTIRERSYALIGKSEDFRRREILFLSLELEEDSRALAAGFRALAKIGMDWDGKSLRLMARLYRKQRNPDDQLTLYTARALVDLIRYNGEISDPAGYELMNNLLLQSAGAQLEEKIFNLFRDVSQL